MCAVVFPHKKSSPMAEGTACDGFFSLSFDLHPKPETLNPKPIHPKPETLKLCGE